MQAIQRSNSFKRLQKGSARNKRPATNQPDVRTVHKDFLMKGDGKGKWSKRWFVLKDTTLYYYEKADDCGTFRDFPAGVLCVKECSLSPAEQEMKKDFCWEIKIPLSQANVEDGLTPRGEAFKMYLCAHYQQDMKTWMEKIAAANVLVTTLKSGWSAAKHEAAEASQAKQKAEEDLQKSSTECTEVKKGLAAKQQLLSTEQHNCNEAQKVHKEQEEQLTQSQQLLDTDKAAVEQMKADIHRYQTVEFEKLLDDIGVGDLQWFGSNIRDIIKQHDTEAAEVTKQKEDLETELQELEAKGGQVSNVEKELLERLVIAQDEAKEASEVKAAALESGSLVTASLGGAEGALAEANQRHEDAVQNKTKSCDELASLQMPLAQFSALSVEEMKLADLKTQLEDELHTLSLSSSQRFAKQMTRKMQVSMEGSSWTAMMSPRGTNSSK